MSIHCYANTQTFITLMFIIMISGLSLSITTTTFLTFRFLKSFFSLRD
jgi:hypothetical protein